MTYSEVLGRFDNLYYDLSRYFSYKQAPQDIVIVAIDEKSLSAIGKWPWDRRIHARLINQLTNENTKAIGLDVIFSEPDLKTPASDAQLADAIAQASNVVLPIFFESPSQTSPIIVNQPIASLSTHAAALGRVHVPLDVDGVARSIYLQEGVGAQPIPLFAAMLLKVSGELPKDAVWSENINVRVVDSYIGEIKRQNLRRVRFLGPPGHFSQISYVDVLEGQYPQNYFQNKIVLVGSVAAGMGDALPTPVSAESQPMSGVEYHANVVASIRDQALVKALPIWLTCLICAVLSLFPLLYIAKLPPLKALLFTMLCYVVVTFIALTLPSLFNIWVPPSGTIVALLLTYPIWSWRKLESAHAYLDQALKQLQAEIASLGLQSKEIKFDEIQDVMQARINKVELTSQYLSDFQQTRLDALAFISHDIRTPLAAALMSLESQIENPAEKNLAFVQPMLVRALNMADEFLQSSRAEMIDYQKFVPINLLALVEQAIDEVFYVARTHHVQVLRPSVAEDAIWVLGDFGLLQRAITNLLLNAVKYSRQGTSVELFVSQLNNCATIAIKDHGPGIPADKLSKLFKRFSRLEGEYQVPTGSGLGLYFVDVCLKKHGGTIKVNSTLGVGTEFTIQLPLVDVESL